MKQFGIKATLLVLAAATLLSGCGYVFPEQIKRSSIDLMLLGQTQQAIDMLNSVISAHPKDHEAYLLRSMAYILDNNTDKALADCNLVLQDDPKNSDALVMRGFVRLKNDLSGAQFAQIDFNKAVSTSPNESWPYLARVISRYKLGNINGAKDDVQKVVALNPKDGATCGALCSELHLLGFQEQYELYDKRLKADSDKQLNQLANFIKSPGTQAPPIPQLDSKFTLAVLASKAISAIQTANRQQGINAYNREIEQMNRDTEQEYQQEMQRARQLQDELASRKEQYRQEMEQRRQQQLQREQQDQQERIQRGMQSLQEELQSR